MRRNKTDDTESTGVINRARGSSSEPLPSSSRGFLGRISGRSLSSSQDRSTSLRERVRGRSTEPETTDSDSWFGRARAKYGLGALLAAAGVVLFLFPEPVTSTTGLVLIGAGVLLWLLG